MSNASSWDIASTIADIIAALGSVGAIAYAVHSNSEQRHAMVSPAFHLVMLSGDARTSLIINNTGLGPAYDVSLMVHNESGSVIHKEEWADLGVLQEPKFRGPIGIQGGDGSNQQQERWDSEKTGRSGHIRLSYKGRLGKRYKKRYEYKLEGDNYVLTDLDEAE